MGIIFSSLFSRFFSSIKPYRILMLGLDNSGKTTILFRLKLGELVTTVPTIASNVETVKYRNFEFTIFDVSLRQIFWRHYYPNTDAVLFVIDSSDSERFDEALEELVSLLSESDLKDVVFLVFADISNKLRFKCNFSQKFFIQKSCAKTGSGIYEGLEWLSNNLND